MSKLTTMRKLLHGNKRQILEALYSNIVHCGITNYFSDEIYLKLSYLVHVGDKLDLDNPKTFSEKIQWLKLHDHNPDYIKMVDKILVKDYVSDIIGAEYTIPTLGVYDSFDEIDFDCLPNQFVLKCNHDSGSIVICRDKANFDKNKARKKLTKALKSDAFYWGREWPYKFVNRKILAEAYLYNDDAIELKENKDKTFSENGKSFLGSKERISESGFKVVFYDTDWKTMPFERYHSKQKLDMKNPLNSEEVFDLAEKLAKDIPFERIDFYKVEGEGFFGEVVLVSNREREEFTPSKWDKTLGTWIKLPGGVVLIKENVIIHFPFGSSIDLTDYKFFCFNGIPKYCQVITGRTKNEKIDFYDMEWNLQSFVGLTSMNGLTPSITNSGFVFPQPDSFENMKTISEKLSAGIPFSRIDFYEVNKKLYFGEITLYPAAGFAVFSPDEWNYTLGELINLER